MRAVRPESQFESRQVKRSRHSDRHCGQPATYQWVMGSHSLWIIRPGSKVSAELKNERGMPPRPYMHSSSKQGQHNPYINIFIYGGIFQIYYPAFRGWCNSFARNGTKGIKVVNISISLFYYRFYPSLMCSVPLHMIYVSTITF